MRFQLQSLELIQKTSRRGKHRAVLVRARKGDSRGPERFRNVHQLLFLDCLVPKWGTPRGPLTLSIRTRKNNNTTYLTRGPSHFSPLSAYQWLRHVYAVIEQGELRSGGEICREQMGYLRMQRGKLSQKREANVGKGENVCIVSRVDGGIGRVALSESETISSLGGGGEIRGDVPPPAPLLISFLARPF